MKFSVRSDFIVSRVDSVSNNVMLPLIDDFRH